MRLISLEIDPRGSNGLSLPQQLFADEVTQLYGPNGSGKTPVVQTIVYCLGFPVSFRADIISRCESASLVIDIKGVRYTLKRYITASGLDIEVREPAGPAQRFSNEKDYSAYLFDLLGLDFPTLVTTSNEPTTPYMATVLPFFYLDQDDGYGTFYKPPKMFIKDQLAEMVRILGRMPCRNSFDAKKDLIQATKERDRLDRLVLERRQAVDSAGATELPLSSDVLSDRLERMREELDQLQQSGLTNTAAIAALEQLIGDRRKELREKQLEIAEIDKRADNMSQIVTEIESEITTLNLNEEAKRVFSLFNEICGVTGCGLFAFSTDSYAKNLLYLRDQIKDLERISVTEGARRDALLQQTEQLRTHIQDLEGQRVRSATDTVTVATRTALDALTNQVLDLEIQKRDVKRRELLLERLAQATEQREAAVDRVQTLANSSTLTPSVASFRTALKTALVRWLDVLQISNVSAEIRFVDDFIPTFGTEALAQLKGSTRVRAVLAYHAALLEALLSTGKRLPFQFIIMDTPKQHEMHNVDIGRYIDELKVFGHKHSVQIVFSATEYRHRGNNKDREWPASFTGEKHEMFLG
ncbi:hypothetical protein B0G75_1233 [Paraburkholderia sp. BL18I3N2]|uniref:hypothetical protein n=1 Tax=Paraburkholderia sp. BL18I3N2 TaxID=1938799 RepID=UPI000D49321A|nr:hypothetical protein [Paraburkholderia sp. BL18I3N2]PRX24099.1 hypothetical protein B0G75_1233 [Paraburkholderia sp. BL18I3N2]